MSKFSYKKILGLVIIWIGLMIIIFNKTRNDYKEKYIVTKESEIYTVLYSNISSSEGTLEGTKQFLQKNDLVFRLKAFEKENFPNYFYIDTEPKQRGALEGFVKKETLRKIEK